MRSFTNLTKTGPGKFAYLVDEIAYGITMNGSDDECGNSSEGPYFSCIIRGAVAIAGAFADIVPAMYLRLSEEDKTFIRLHPAGFILTENSDGFTEVTWYSTEKERETSWSELVKAVAEFEAGVV